MNRNSNHLGIHENVPQSTIVDLEHEIRSDSLAENEGVMSFLTSNNFTNLMNETVNNSNSNDPQQPNMQEQSPGFANLAIRGLQSSFPFLIIALVKLLHQHFFGFLIVIGFLTTQHFANKILVNQIELKVFDFSSEIMT